MESELNVDRVKRRRGGKRRRRSSKRSGCGPVKITRGPMRGRYRNSCTGRLTRKPRK